jgi:hypothetical protein
MFVYLEDRERGSSLDARRSLGEMKRRFHGIIYGRFLKSPILSKLTVVT